MANWQDYVTLDSIGAIKDSEFFQFLPSTIKRTLERDDPFLEGDFRDAVIKSLEEMASTKVGMDILKGAFEASGNKKVPIVFGQNDRSLAFNFAGISLVQIGWFESGIQFCDSNMENCKDGSLQSVLAHELSHIKNRHSSLLIARSLTELELSISDTKLSADAESAITAIRNKYYVPVLPERYRKLSVYELKEITEQEATWDQDYYMASAYSDFSFRGDYDKANLMGSKEWEYNSSFDGGNPIRRAFNNATSAVYEMFTPDKNSCGNLDYRNACPQLGF